MYPDTMYQYAKIRHAEDLRKVEAARLAMLAQSKKTSRAQELLNNVVGFAKRAGAKSIETAQTGEVLRIKSSREQA